MNRYTMPQKMYQGMNSFIFGACFVVLLDSSGVEPASPVGADVLVASSSFVVVVLAGFVFVGLLDSVGSSSVSDARAVVSVDAVSKWKMR